MAAKINKIQWLMLAVAVLLGILIIKQIRSVNSSKDITKQDNVMNLSYEIIESSSNIFDLQGELIRLKDKNDSFSFDIKDKEKVKADLEAKINNYRLINGAEKIKGRGIEIIVDGDTVTEEMVDLINGIRNTKPTAIAINGKRVIYKSSFVMNGKTLEFDDNKFNLPFTVQIVGDPDVLKKSLDRTGGILDILKKNSYDKLKFQVNVKDVIELEPYDQNILFKYAKITSL